MKKRAILTFFLLICCAFTAACKTDGDNTAPTRGYPVFSQSEYQYDKAVAGEFELPVDLSGGIASVAEFDGNRILSADFRYDGTKKCLVLTEKFMLQQEVGNYLLRLITTEGSAEVAVVVKNTVETSFDEIRKRAFAYGKDSGVVFEADFADAAIAELYVGEKSVSVDYCGYADGKFTVKSELLTHVYGSTDFRVVLSNHDFYRFSVVSDAIFFTDYDLTTIHDPAVSTIGGNSLYQNTDWISIVDTHGVAGLTGKALKFTPVTADGWINSIFTLKKAGVTGYDLWRQIPVNNDKYYLYTFDYVLSGTASGDRLALVGSVSTSNTFDSVAYGLVDMSYPETKKHLAV